MVQYLYAAYSLGGKSLQEANGDDRTKIASWRNTIIEIARQEMGHLVTVQNVLTLINGPLSLDRQDYPMPDRESDDDRASMYPFHFELEPLTRKSLGKYVLAEMPSEDHIRLLEKAGKLEVGEIEAIKKLVVGSDTGWNPLRIHRVGVIYEKIRELFQCTNGKDCIQPEDISAKAQQFQVQPSAWGLGYPDLIIATPSNRDEAVKALSSIDAQGEGFIVENFATSHFGRFLLIYREFPAKEKNRPLRNVMRNPSTSPHAPRARRLTDRHALLWARLFNTRYRMLLMLLSHSFCIEGPPDGPPAPSRGLLISWAFGEMYNLRSIAEILMNLPQNSGHPEPLAGPPFEMPYSMTLAPREPGRWRLHRDLLLASEEDIEKLLELDRGHEIYLRGLSEVDQKALKQIHIILGGIE